MSGRLFEGGFRGMGARFYASVWHFFEYLFKYPVHSQHGFLCAVSSPVERFGRVEPWKGACGRSLLLHKALSAVFFPDSFPLRKPVDRAGHEDV